MANYCTTQLTIDGSNENGKRLRHEDKTSCNKVIIGILSDNDITQYLKSCNLI